MRKTKIVCTIGPVTSPQPMLKKLIKAGMNVARVNMSHGDHTEQAAKIANIKAVRTEMNAPLALLVDTKGPEVRVKTFADGKVDLIAGDKFVLTTTDIVGTRERVSISYDGLPKLLKPGHQILLNDGHIELKVDKVEGTEIFCTIIVGGKLSNRKSINMPEVDIDMPYISEADKKDILFAIKQGADFLAISFVRTVEDVRDIRKFLSDNGAMDIEIISKIENRQGVNNIKEILAESDGVMVARGDMGVEIPFEELPNIQKSIIKDAYTAGKKVITATQMLDSMENSPRPTRAEISDVANAVYDGTSATMLSGETASGKYPIETVVTMAKIAEQAERNIKYKEVFNQLSHKAKIESITDAVSHSSVGAAYDLNAKAILVVTQTGRTARKISRWRPITPIIAAVTSPKAYHQLSLNWGVTPVLAKHQLDTDDLLDHSLKCAKSTGLVKKGDLVVMTAGVPIAKGTETNLMKIDKVK
ncbi:MAG: pyruvate kinase [Firmicutes bacterium]|nr:pyruvate kinase [Bacillota bacterium]